MASELEAKLTAAFVRHEVEAMQAQAKALLEKQITRLTTEDELLQALGIERPKPAKVEVNIEGKQQQAAAEKASVKEETKTPRTEAKVEVKKPAPK